MAGPWFTVQTGSQGWQEVGTLLVSDGEAHVKARVELRVSLEEFDASE